jgi:EpsI family protein
MAMVRWRLPLLNCLLLLTLLCSHRGRSVEGASLVHSDFLRALPLPFRDWKPVVQSIPPSELNLLEPDATLMRHYVGTDGQWAELAIIAGHRKKSIHTPGFCMAGGGWDVLTQHGSTLTVSDRRIPAIRMLLSKDGHQMLVTYFFTDGEYYSSNLIQFQCAQLLKRIEARVPLGALVRITVPVATSEADAATIAGDFTQATLPAAMAALRQARLDIH